LTAPQLLEHLKNKQLQYNKTSVYRALDKLLAQDIICKQNFGDNDIQYELRTSHHDHLVCVVCGNINSVECTLQPPNAIGDFKVDHHHVTYFGTCQECQQKAISEN
jgi:Fur family peroxide stress response transcriptional regulator